MDRIDNYKEIRAVYDDDIIRVYQAYSPVIADEAVKKGTFGEHFKMGRMTWIKPSFLWMMFRCGWATKKDQERVLGIDIRREGFDHALQHSVLSTYKAETGLSHEQWQEMVKNSDVRVQWDPEKDIYGNDLPYRSIQIGLRGNAVYEYVNSWIVNIEDITDHVKQLDKMRQGGSDISELLPKERVYPLEPLAGW